MGIRTIMVTGDNKLTAATIARRPASTTSWPKASPRTRWTLIRREQAEGKLVAMTGDGTNDAPALAQADVGVAMNSGTQAAKEAGNMVDLDTNPTKLIEIVAIGKQLLMTRGALTTFSIANDVAKYFAILPAMFAGCSLFSARSTSCTCPPHSAILGRDFNALGHRGPDPPGLRGVNGREQPLLPTTSWWPVVSSSMGLAIELPRCTVLVGREPGRAPLGESWVLFSNSTRLNTKSKFFTRTGRERFSPPPEKPASHSIWRTSFFTLVTAVIFGLAFLRRHRHRAPDLSSEPDG